MSEITVEEEKEFLLGKCRPQLVRMAELLDAALSELEGYAAVGRTPSPWKDQLRYQKMRGYMLEILNGVP